MRSLVAIMQWICRNLSTGERMQHDSSTNATGSAHVHALTGKEKIEVVQKQIEYLLTEVDNRISVNNTLWRAILTGLGGLILLKEQLNLDQFLFVVPALVMVLLSQWLNQMFTIFRAGTAMAEAEHRINLFAGETLLSHELKLLQERKTGFQKRQVPILLVGVGASIIYWWLEVRLLDGIAESRIRFWELGMAQPSLPTGWRELIYGDLPLTTRSRTRNSTSVFRIIGMTSVTRPF